MSVYWNESVARLVSAVLPTITPEWWGRRYDVLNYVNLCEMRGFASTDDLRRQCAERYMAGKRKVTAPGARRRKTNAKKRASLMANQPKELIDAIEAACRTKAAEQVDSENSKAINALVGAVLSKYKTDPAVVRGLLVQRLLSGGAARV